MGTEIERKFLVNGDAWRDGARRLPCAQGYLLTGPPVSVRVRVIGDEGRLTVKTDKTGITRGEFEYAIPVDDAQELLSTACNAVVEKTRYILDHAGMTWEVDEFHGENEGLVVAEIELESENQAFDTPPWLGEEVSHDRRYLNSSLSKHPYREWADE